MWRYLIRYCVFSKVWITQWSTRDRYEVGDSAVLQCNISSQGETLKGCKIFWAVLNPSNRNKTKKVETVEDVLQDRVQVHQNGTFSTITIHRLSENDMELLFCTVSCMFSGTLRQISGSGTSLIITERQPEPPPSWLKYLFFSVNLLVFLTATIICALIIRKRMQNNQTRPL
ncbi:hypothetical protein NFI96_024811 [Prochilodus magdalenae]|nr:hypothetical protein NFI96_024811 [Prochilodus magdalenae]